MTSQKKFKMERIVEEKRKDVSFKILKQNGTISVSMLFAPHGDFLVAIQKQKSEHKIVVAIEEKKSESLSILINTFKGIINELEHK
jgi:hypothetical protein